MTRRALIGMGSNIEPARHLRRAAEEIRARFPGARFSRVYRSPPLGMAGDDFLNACCLLATSWSQARLIAWLKRLEDDHGRVRAGGSWVPRTLDLDLLWFGDQTLDPEALIFAHVALPARELLPELVGSASQGTAEVTALNL